MVAKSVLHRLAQTLWFPIFDFPNVKIPTNVVVSTTRFLIWVWVNIKPPGIGPQALVNVPIFQGKPFWGYLMDGVSISGCVFVFFFFFRPK